MTTASARYSPVRDLGDLLAAMPAVLGYRPRDAVVVVVCEKRAIQVTLRMEVDWFVVDFDVVADHLYAVAERYPYAQVFLLGYCDEVALAEASLGEAAAILGGLVADAVFTDGTRWWSLCCPGDCCPPEGRPFSFEDSKINAEAVVAGVSIVRSRDEVIAGVGGPDEDRQRELAGLFHDAYLMFDGGTDIELMDALLGERASILADEPAQALTLDRCARMAVLMDDPGALSALVAAVTPESAVRDREWLLQVCAQCLDRYAPGVLAVLAFVSWLSGGGPVLSAALARLHQLEPGHPVIDILGDLMVQLVPPRKR